MNSWSLRIERGLVMCLVAVAAGFGAGCATSRAPRAEPSGTQTSAVVIGIASYYGKAHHGKRTASGERFNMHGMTAAHQTLPFGTQVKVTHLENDRSVVVRINDRGPFKRGRIIDLSQAAARKLKMIGSGTARVRLKVHGDKHAGSTESASIKP